MQAVIQITAIGLASSLGSLLLKRAGREDIASVVALAGLLMTLLVVFGLMKEFFLSVQSVLGGLWQ
ncbi:MAG: SpoIIIAC/SpoIIIAD family protein [Eubacteriales bacterium]|nr:SpoIIIAC/SpoIIIAD family protein [Eubacteriales bacterium]